VINSQSNDCEFDLHYPDSITKKTKYFKCKNPAIRNNRCEFHDESYLTETTKQTVIDSFQNILKNYNKPGESLKFVGYHLSEVIISGEIVVPVDFTQAHFHDDVIIENVKFNEDVQFSETEFYETHRVSFIGSEFCKKVHFLSSNIRGREVQFHSSAFLKEVDFTGTTIFNAFFNTSNLNNATFTNVIFHGPVNFWYADFNGITKFTGATFNDSVKFSNSIFKDEGNFQKTNFFNTAYFREVQFNEPSKIIFNSNLHYVSFLDTDLKRIRFGNNVEWHLTKSPKTKWGKFKYAIEKISLRNNKFKIHDERTLDNQTEPELNLESVMDTYRDLRDNYDYELRYETAGQFFVREMELKRKFKANRDGFPKTKKDFRRRVFSIYNFYHILAQYGQSYYRPIWVALPVLIISFFCLVIESG